MTGILYEDRARDLVVRCAPAPDDAFVALLDRTTWGTSGLTYQVVDFRHVLARWKVGRFFSLEQGGETVAGFLIVPRAYDVDGFRFQGGFRTLLAVAEGHQNAGLGRVIAEVAKRRLLDEAAGPTMLYGFVESANERSMRLQRRLGYERLVSFEALTVGPLRSRAIEVEPLAEADEPEVRAAIAEQLRGHVLVDVDQSFAREEYFVLRRGGRIVAGCQALPKEMRIRALGGVSGRLLLRAGPWLSRVSPFFGFDPMRHVWCGHLFCRGADARPLVELIEGVIHLSSASSAVLYLDGRSPLRSALGRAGLGAVHALAPTAIGEVLVGFAGIPDPVRRALAERPLAFSPLDCI